MTMSHRIFIAVLLILLGSLQYRLWVGQGSFAHVNDLRVEVERRIAENQESSQRNDILKAEILDLKQGLTAAEDIARSEMGLIKKGETFFLLAED